MDLVNIGQCGSWSNMPVEDYWFWFLFIFRYLRLIVNIIGYALYRPFPIPTEPTIMPQDCTIVIPTVDPGNVDFLECLTTVLANQPSAVLIVTVGRHNLNMTRNVISSLQASYANTTIEVLQANIANKRQQVAEAIPHVKTSITVLVDDHVFWPSTRFLRSAIAPFEDPSVGGVGTNKRVRRDCNRLGIFSFWNIMGALYLERHNFEIRATNAIDGGVFVISGRTAAYRTCILQNSAFLSKFIDERFFFGLFGPLNADDDNFITRWLVKCGWKIKIQYCPDSMIETTLGTYPKFLSQCLRWARTTWRSNPASLFTDRTVWYAQPWCVYAVYLSSLVNFALFYDAALVFIFSNCSFWSTDKARVLIILILSTKLIKILPYFLRHPTDMIFLPGYYLFAYFHSFIKLYAGLTFWVTTWGGRDLPAVTADSDDFDESPFPPSNFSLKDSKPKTFFRHSAPVSHSRKKPYLTPWGTVSPTDPHTKPANLNENLNPNVYPLHRREHVRAVPKSHNIAKTGIATDSSIINHENVPFVRNALLIGFDGNAEVEVSNTVPGSLIPENDNYPDLRKPDDSIVSKAAHNRHSWIRGPHCNRMHIEDCSSAWRQLRVWDRKCDCSRLHSERCCAHIGHIKACVD